jgi:hypothetical protein
VAKLLGTCLVFLSIPEAYLNPLYTSSFIGPGDGVVNFLSHPPLFRKASRPPTIKGHIISRKRRGRKMGGRGEGEEDGRGWGREGGLMLLFIPQKVPVYCFRLPSYA